MSFGGGTAYTTEAIIAKALVQHALASGYHLSVNDGEDIVVSKSTCLPDITQAMASTYADWLIIHRYVSEGRFEYVGRVLLIWGNGVDVISDYSDNPPTDALVASLGVLIDSLGEDQDAERNR